MKKSINNFENKKNQISFQGLNQIKGGGKPKSVPKSNTSSKNGHSTLIK